MKPKREIEEKPTVSKTMRLMRWAGIIVAVFLVVGLLGTWLTQRSLRTPNKKREMQLWLERNLNADITSLGDMAVRVNLTRPSQLVFHQVEITHPNIAFEGNMARIGRLAIEVPPWTVARLMQGRLDVGIQDAVFSFEQSESGEWSHDGLMRPLAVSESAFPLPMPRLSEWRATLENSRLSVLRRGYRLDVGLNGDIFTRSGRKRINVRADRTPFSFGPEEGPVRFTGSAGPVELQFFPTTNPGDAPVPVPGRCTVAVRDLPVSILPFFFGGIPMEETSGAFHGMVQYAALEGAEGALVLEGELTDVPLAVFGLPPRSPLRLTWPIAPQQDNLEAKLHMGPAGFGAFEITVPVDVLGRPRFLSMRGDVAALDGIPAFFTRYSRWPDWLARTFPSVEWQSRVWRGFGWNGNNLRLSLNRGTAGFNLTGEAELMGGRVRIAMTPDIPDAPISIAAEKLDAALLTGKMSRLLPEPFQATVRGSHVNLTWRGYPSRDGELNEWGAGMVWSKPVVHFRESGSWWRALRDLPNAIAGALPDWGGGETDGLQALTGISSVSLEQLSVVTERERNGDTAVEFRAYGESIGQITGMVETRRDGLIEGEFLLAGTSDLLREVELVNPGFAFVLELLANDSPGLRVSFRIAAGGEPEFTYIFLEDAKRVREQLRRGMEAQP